MKKLLYALSFAALYVAAVNAVSTQSVTDSVTSTLPSITTSVTSEAPVSNDSDDNSATTKANLEVAALSSSSDDSDEEAPASTEDQPATPTTSVNALAEQQVKTILARLLREMATDLEEDGAEPTPAVTSSGTVLQNIDLSGMLSNSDDSDSDDSEDDDSSE